MADPKRKRKYPVGGGVGGIGIGARTFPPAMSSSMLPAGAPTGARHHQTHHQIFGSLTTPSPLTGVRPALTYPARQNQHQQQHQQHQQQQQQHTTGVPASNKILEFAGNGHAITAVSATYGAASEQGRRPTMEDVHHVVRDLFPSGDKISLFFVCDGHSGKHVADLAAVFLPQVLQEGDSHKLLADPAGALRECFIAVDRAIYRKVRGRDGGATCTAALIAGSTLWIANLGDSRAVASEAGTAIQLSRDHKPFDTAEAHRVERCGGFIAYGRVGGCLAITRAFGDFELKGGDRVLKEVNIPVSNTPEISKFTMTSNTEFVIVACDGVWDVMSSQEAVSIVRRDLSKGVNVAASSLVRASIEKGSCDNVTALVASFATASQGSPYSSSPLQHNSSPYGQNGTHQKPSTALMPSRLSYTQPHNPASAIRPVRAVARRPF
eukprot:TRINITY_DN2132_c3_g1_i1.p1 TRINITY_DN2132_c3_g1~~TRINITY_DN2132_c3_g1_i1.p1  ORF type:complete len:437 (+),score=66.85 TRINITY_DN2132_c3_g1_i1:127-1437(+)